MLNESLHNFYITWYDRIFVKINKFYAHFMGETGPSKLHEMEKKRLTLLLEYYNQKYNRTKYEFL